MTEPSQKRRKITTAPLVSKETGLIDKILSHPDNKGKYYAKHNLYNHRKDYVEIIKELCELGIDVAATSENGTNSLFYASIHNLDVEIIKTLIACGVDANARSCRSMSPLAFACKHKADTNLIKALIEAGADVNVIDKDKVPLITAICVGMKDTRIFDILVESKANVDAQDPSGKTPLIACCSGCTNIMPIKALIKAGANVNTCDIMGMTPLMHTCHPDVCNILGYDVSALDALIEADADVNAKNIWGSNTLMMACEHDSGLVIVNKLLEKKVDVYALDNSGVTVLERAFSNKSLKKGIIESIISAGFDMSKRNKKNIPFWDFIPVSVMSIELLSLYNKYLKEKSDNMGQSICVICLDLLMGNITQLVCGHKYHLGCVIELIHEKGTECPLCKYKFL